MITKEEQALAVSNSRTLLRKRINSAKTMLIKEYRLLFGKGASFDFDNKRIVSSDGKLALQWMLRDRPDQPESYRNQQTNQGVVRLVKLKEN